MSGPTWMNRRLLVGITLALTCVTQLTGCGGTRQAKQQASAPNATVRFVIRWPNSAGRLIPAEANRILVFVNGEGILGTVAYALDKSAFGGTAVIDVPIPAGPKRLFSAEARKVDNPRFFTAERIPHNSPVLHEGTLLASGKDNQAHDVGLFQTVQADIEIVEAGQPGPGTTQVTITVNQVLTECFPSVLVLEILRDQNGDPLTNLTKANFEILEDGQPAVITDVRTVLEADQPLSVVLVLDRSSSMGSQGNANLEAAATTFVNLMGPDDAAEVINFSTSVTVEQGFTTDKQLLVQAIQGRSASGSTALWDAVGRAVTDISARAGRRAVIAMTDGYNNNSRTYDKESVIAAAQAVGVPVFTIGLGSSIDPGLPDVANQTGGIHVNAPTSADLDAIYRKIAGQLAGQLQISFISPDPSVSNRQRHLIVRYHYGSFTGESNFSYTM